MAFLPAGYAQQTAEAKVTTRSDRRTDGEYLDLILGCEYVITQSGPALIFEHRVVESKPKKEGVLPNAPGSKVGYFLPDYGKAAIMLKPNLKLYTLGLLGLNKKDVDASDAAKQAFARQCADLFEEKQMCRGMLIRGSTFHTDTKEGEDFLGVNWSQADGNDPASVAKRRAELDKERAAEAASAAPANGAAAGPPVPGTPPIPGAKSYLVGWQPYPAGTAPAPDGTPWYWKGTTVLSEAALARGEGAGK